MKNHYGIIETGLAPETLSDEYGNYLDMGKSLVEGCIAGASFETYSPVSGDPLPEPHHHDGYIVMGSEHSVYDGFSWIDELMDFIRQTAAATVPLVGLCFGHQLIAQALGGHVEKKDWVVGAVDYKIEGGPDSIRSIAYHQDQVTRVPGKAKVVLSNKECQFAGLRYLDFPGWSIQSHPEFTVPFSRALVAHTRLESLDDDVADRALESLSGPIKLDYIQAQIRSVLAQL